MRFPRPTAEESCKLAKERIVVVLGHLKAVVANNEQFKKAEKILKKPKKRNKK